MKHLLDRSASGQLAKVIRVKDFSAHEAPKKECVNVTL